MPLTYRYSKHWPNPSSTPIFLRFLTLCSFLSNATPFINSTLYDCGYLGAYPYEKYHSADLIAPRLNILRWDSACDDKLILFTPRGSSVPNDGPMIVDAKGHLIWTEKIYGTADNLQIQTYKGKPYLTFWAGHHERFRWPGKYYMLDSSYEVKYIVTPVGYDFGDLHEFTITDGGTALMTIYDPLPWDLSRVGGPVVGWILDCLIQDVDIETGDLIFEWRASAHYDPNDTYAPIESFGTSADNALDYIHINSIDKDKLGNYFISGRMTCEIAYINANDGSLIWRFGGRHSSFTDLSDGAASNFTYQHHMRYHGVDEEDPSGNSIVISVFDNAKFQRYRSVARESRGLLISLDLHAMTAKLIQDFKPLLHTLSHSQGNMQVLSSGEVSARQSNKLVGWGHSAGWTTFGPAGNVLCDVHFGGYAMHNLGWAVSYRVFQYDINAWIGVPKHRPAIAAGVTFTDSNSIYASWNGATVIKIWRLQGTESWSLSLDSDAVTWTDLQESPKDGFEVVFIFKPFDQATHLRWLPQHAQTSDNITRYRYYRVQALDNDGQILAATPPVDTRTMEVASQNPCHRALVSPWLDADYATAVVRSSSEWIYQHWQSPHTAATGMRLLHGPSTSIDSVHQIEYKVSQDEQVFSWSWPSPPPFRA